MSYELELSEQSSKAKAETRAWWAGCAHTRVGDRGRWSTSVAALRGREASKAQATWGFLQPKKAKGLQGQKCLK